MSALTKYMSTLMKCQTAFGGEQLPESRAVPEPYSRSGVGVISHAIVARVAGQQVDRMLQDGANDGKAFAHGFRRAGKVYD